MIKYYSTDASYSSFTVDVDETSICINDPDNSERPLSRFTFPLDAPQIFPGTCHGLQICRNDSLHHRFRLKESTTDSQDDTADVNSRDGSREKWTI